MEPSSSTSSSCCHCRIVFSTQSGRARACARRTARILHEEQQQRHHRGTGDGHQHNDRRRIIHLTNNIGATFDDDVFATAGGGGGGGSSDNSSSSLSSSPLVEFVTRLKRSAATAPSSLPLLLMFVSTTGDGEQTDTIRRTWNQLLQKTVPPKLFAGVSIAVFNLGDRAYGDQYCAAGRKLTVRLLQLGATLLCDPGYGDDGTPHGGVFADLDPWIEDQLLVAIRNKSGVVANAISDSSKGDPRSISSKSPAPSNHLYRVRVVEEEAGVSSCKNDQVNENNQEEEEWEQERFADAYRLFFQQQCPVTAYHYECHRSSSGDEETMTIQRRRPSTDKKGGATLSSPPPPLITHVRTNHRITPTDWEQETRHLRLEVVPPRRNKPSRSSLQSTAATMSQTSGSAPLVWDPDSLPYRAGDVAVVMPSNSPDEVDRFIQVLPRELQQIADQVLEIDTLINSSDNGDDGGGSFLFGVGYKHWPKLCTLRGWLTFAADIHDLPAREDLRALSYCCSLQHEHGKDQRDKLLSLSEPSANALYGDYILRQKRSWCDVMYDFAAIREPVGSTSLLTIERLLALLSPIRPREFSIASSPSQEWLQKTSLSSSVEEAVSLGEQSSQQDTCSSFGIDFCVAVVKGSTLLGRKYHGLCSHYLSKLSPIEMKDTGGRGVGGGSRVRLWIRPGSFHNLPLNMLPRPDANNDNSHGTGQHLYETPVLFVGAGTGIAPLRGLIHERSAVAAIQNKTCRKDSTLPSPGNGANTSADAGGTLDRDNILVFGCRKEKIDFYYQDDWNQLGRRGELGLLTAFSRDDKRRKIYVQTVMRQIDKDQTFYRKHLLQNHGSVYIAGNPKMARAVKDEMVESLSKELAGGEKEAQQFLRRLQRAGKLCIEAW